MDGTGYKFDHAGGNPEREPKNKPCNDKTVHCTRFWKGGCSKEGQCNFTNSNAEQRNTEVTNVGEGE